MSCSGRDLKFRGERWWKAWVNPFCSTADSPVSVCEGSVSVQCRAQQSGQLQGDTGREDFAILYGSSWKFVCHSFPKGPGCVHQYVTYPRGLSMSSDYVMHHNHTCVLGQTESVNSDVQKSWHVLLLFSTKAVRKSWCTMLMPELVSPFGSVDCILELV